MGSFTPWQTPGGNRFLLAPVPWVRNTLVLWDAARDVWDWPDPVPVMPAPEARAYLETAEDAHFPHGFHVQPGWRGLRIPSSCPAGVALDLQACFLATAYAAGGGR